MPGSPYLAGNRFTVHLIGRLRWATVLFRFFLVLCFLLSVATFVQVGAGAQAPEPDEPLPEAAPAWSNDPEAPLAEGDIEFRMQDEGISREEAVRRFRIEDAASALQLEAGERWPGAYAGLWIDHEPFGVKVAFTENAGAYVDQLRKEFPYPSSLEAFEAKMSLRALTQLQDRMVNDRHKIEQDEAANRFPTSMRATRGVYALGLDVPKGNVVVYVERPTQSLDRDFKSRYGSDVVVRQGTVELEQCQIRACEPAMLGGLELVAGDGGLCTSAFFARWRPNNARAVLSAGHCSERDGVVYGRLDRFHEGVRVGDVSYIEYHRRWDAERIGVAPHWRESSKFFVEGEDPRMITSWMPWANMPLNVTIGKTGRTTGTTRGWVRDTSFAPPWIPNAEQRFIVSTYCSDGGDSGGAVWRQNAGWGIHHGSLISQDFGECRGADRLDDDDDPHRRGIFSSLEFAQEAMNVWLPTGVNISPIARQTRTCEPLTRTCTFRGGGSEDQDGSIVAYTWTFSDGTTRSGQNVTHTFPLFGNQWARLTVRDNDGATHSVREDFFLL